MTTTTEADRMIAAAAHKGVKIVASPGMMLFPLNQRESRLVLSHALGDLTWIITDTAGVGDYQTRSSSLGKTS